MLPEYLWVRNNQTRFIPIPILLLVILIIILIFAIVWENNDIKRIKNLPNVMNVQIQDRTDLVKDYACYPANGLVTWRGAFISTVIATLLIGYALYAFGWSYNINHLLILALIVFLSIYGVSAYRSFHFFGVICNKFQNFQI